MSEKPCVFCDRSQLEGRLVAEVGNFYIVPTLGQITDGGYVLLVPKRHVSCIGAMEVAEIEEMIIEAMSLDECLHQEYKIAHSIIFEHGIVGQSIKHAHLHFVPAHCALTERIQKDFPDKEIIAINSLADLRFWHQTTQKPYLFWNDYFLKSMICLDPPAPPQYLRRVIAEIIGRPERADWRAVDAESDQKLCLETAERLEKYY